MIKSIPHYITLILAIAFYSCVGICTRYAAEYPFLSMPYIAMVAGAVAILGIYAIAWQQIIRLMPISTAYMFRGLGIVFTLIMCHYIFNEAISTQNIVGSAIIIGGITLYSAMDAQEKKEEQA